ncbi:MAG: hypothetical protein WCP89_02180 [archaeon]
MASSNNQWFRLAAVFVIIFLIVILGLFVFNKFKTGNVISSEDISVVRKITSFNDSIFSVVLTVNSNRHIVGIKENLPSNSFMISSSFSDEFDGKGSKSSSGEWILASSGQTISTEINYEIFVSSSFNVSGFARVFDGDILVSVPITGDSIFTGGVDTVGFTSISEVVPQFASGGGNRGSSSLGNNVNQSLANRIINGISEVFIGGDEEVISPSGEVEIPAKTNKSLIGGYLFLIITSILIIGGVIFFIIRFWNKKHENGVNVTTESVVRDIQSQM